jgi:hypothetical protein
MVRPSVAFVAGILAGALLAGGAALLLTRESTVGARSAPWRPGLAELRDMFTADVRAGRTPDEVVIIVKQQFATDAYWTQKPAVGYIFSQGQKWSLRAAVTQLSEPVERVDFEGRTYPLQRPSQEARVRFRAPGAPAGPAILRIKVEVTVGPTPTLAKAPLLVPLRLSGLQATVAPDGAIRLAL